MKYLFSPQRNDDKLEYSFNGDEVTATLIKGHTVFTENEEGEQVEDFIIDEQLTEVFDFTGLPDGEAEEITPEILPINPIVKAERTDGELYLELLNFIGENATEQERFPEVVEV